MQPLNVFMFTWSERHTEYIVFTVTTVMVMHGNAELMEF